MSPEAYYRCFKHKMYKFMHKITYFSNKYSENTLSFTKKC